MKRLLIVILVAAGLWSAYWFVGAAGTRSAFLAWFDERRAQGWVADYDDFALRGFPNRFDATWQNLSLADPATGLAIDLPIFQILALSYRPTHVITVGPHELRIATPTEKFTLASDQLRASLRLEPGPALALERAQFEATNLVLTGADTGALDVLNLAAQRTDTATYRYGIEARGLTPPATALRAMLGDAALPDRMEHARLDALITFDKPWDLSALDVTRPQPTRIELSSLQAQWGVMAFQAKGEIDIDDAGRPSGTLAVQATHWQDMLAIARQSGALPENMTLMVEGLLSMAAQASGNPEKLDAEITLRNGQAFMGFIPLGPVGPIRLR